MEKKRIGTIGTYCVRGDMLRQGYGLISVVWGHRTSYESLTGKQGILDSPSARSIDYARLLSISWKQISTFVAGYKVMMALLFVLPTRSDTIYKIRGHILA